MQTIAIILSIIFILVALICVYALWKDFPIFKDCKWIGVICCLSSAAFGGILLGVAFSDSTYDYEYSASKYALDYKIVTTQVNSTVILRDTTYVLTKK